MNSFSKKFLKISNRFLFQTKGQKKIFLFLGIINMAITNSFLQLFLNFDFISNLFFEGIKLQKPDVHVISNVTVDISEDESQIKNNLVNQVTEMVRWRETMTKFVDMGVEELYEIGSGSVLSNLAKRSCPSFKRMSAGSKESVENLLLEFDS